MIREFRIQNLEFRIIFIVFFLLLASCFLLFTAHVKADTPCGSAGSNPRAQGLVTAPDISGKFGTNSGCASDKKTTFITLKTYDDLKVTYFDKSKMSNKNKITDGVWPTADFSEDGLYWITGDIPDLTINTPDPTNGDGTQVVFVDGNLSINQDIKYHTSDGGGGLVFIVKKDIYIKKTVNQIDAVLISFGSIYTASTNSTPCTTNAEQVPALNINGSLITLNPDPTDKIFFCRKLANNNLPAEVINAQIKYLVLLRNMLSEVIERWSEL